MKCGELDPRMKIVICIFLWLLATLSARAQTWNPPYTPSQVLANGAGFQAFSDRQLSESHATLLSYLVYGQVINPGTILANGAAWQSLSDAQLKQAIAELLLENLSPYGTRTAMNPRPLGSPVSYIQRGSTSTGYIFYDPATNGLVREFSIVSSVNADSQFLLSTNIEVRAFVGFGTATNTLIPDLNYLVFRLPVRVALGCQFQTNRPAYAATSNPSYFQIRNSRWIDSKVSQLNGNWYLRCKVPMQYTNGMELILWDATRNTRVTNGWFTTVYERGTVPPPFTGYLTRSTVFSNIVFGSAGSGTNNTVLATNGGPGVYVGTMVSGQADDADVGWLESKWTFVMDSNPALWQSSGGEDYFHNPFYFQWHVSDNWSSSITGTGQDQSPDQKYILATDIGYDYGTTYSFANFSGASLTAREGYRWFNQSDAPVWTNSMAFKYLFDTNGSSIFTNVLMHAVSIYISPRP